MNNAVFKLTIRSSGFCLCKATGDHDGGGLYGNVQESTVNMPCFDRCSSGHCGQSLFVTVSKGYQNSYSDGCSALCAPQLNIGRVVNLVVEISSTANPTSATDLEERVRP